MLGKREQRRLARQGKRTGGPATSFTSATAHGGKLPRDIAPAVLP